MDEERFSPGNESVPPCGKKQEEGGQILITTLLDRRAGKRDVYVSCLTVYFINRERRGLFVADVYRAL